MPNPPPGFRFHKGLDGLLVGFTIVFLVKTHLVLSGFINWWTVPQWTYEPVMDAATGMAESASGFADVVGSGIQLTGGGGGADVPLSSPVFDMALSGGVKVVGIPVFLSGALRAGVVEQLLIVLGFWVGTVVPLYWWGLRPAYFWWQGIEEEETAGTA